MERRATYQSQPAEAEQTAPGSNDQNQQSRFNVQSPEITNTRVQESTPATKDLFHQFLSRAMFSCATKYVGVLQKLNKLIVVSQSTLTLSKYNEKITSSIPGCPPGVQAMPGRDRRERSVANVRGKSTPAGRPAGHDQRTVQRRRMNSAASKTVFSFPFS
jgi:hypothetical protein